MLKRKALNLGLVAWLLVTLAVLGGCTGIVPEGTEEGGFDWTLIIFLVLIFAMLYFVMIRPQRKRQKEHQQLVLELRKGDKVVTAGGIYGVIESTSEDSIVIKIESGATIRIARGSVVSKRER